MKISRRTVLTGMGKTAIVGAVAPVAIASTQAVGATGPISWEFAALARTCDQFATLALHFDCGGPAEPLLTKLQAYYLNRTNIAHDAVYEIWRKAYVQAFNRAGAS